MDVLGPPHSPHYGSNGAENGAGSAAQARATSLAPKRSGLPLASFGNKCCGATSRRQVGNHWLLWERPVALLQQTGVSAQSGLTAIDA